MEELIDDMKTAEKEIASAAEEAATSPNTPQDRAAETREETVNGMRSDFLQLSEDGANTSRSPTRETSPLRLSKKSKRSIKGALKEDQCVHD